LGSDLIKGVGRVIAKRIVAHFGLETLEVIEHQIERLVEVPGIAKKRVKLIQAAWAAQKAIKEVMLFLQGHGVSTTYAVKIYKQYGDESIATVTCNPYQLATDVYGIGLSRQMRSPVTWELRLTLSFAIAAAPYMYYQKHLTCIIRSIGRRALFFTSR
jgi:ATP-dependent exoDNAse (exonuclease V) alpha subunit